MRVVLWVFLNGWSRYRFWVLILVKVGLVWFFWMLSRSIVFCWWWLSVVLMVRWLMRFLFLFRSMMLLSWLLVSLRMLMVVVVWLFVVLRVLCVSLCVVVSWWLFWLMKCWWWLKWWNDFVRWVCWVWFLKFVLMLLWCRCCLKGFLVSVVYSWSVDCEVLVFCRCCCCCVCVDGCWFCWILYLDVVWVVFFRRCVGVGYCWYFFGYGWYDDFVYVWGERSYLWCLFGVVLFDLCFWGFIVVGWWVLFWRFVDDKVSFWLDYLWWCCYLFVDDYWRIDFLGDGGVVCGVGVW